MNTWILFMQVFLISAGAVFLAMGTKFTVPMAVNEAPAIWSIIRSWLRPFYLHIVINGIIITIAASSRFRQSQSVPPPVQSQHLASVKTPPPEYFAAFSSQPEVRTIVEIPQAAAAVYESQDRVVELKPVMVNGLEVDMEAEEETVADTEAEIEDEDAFLDRTLTCNTQPPDIISPEFQLEYLSPVKPIRNIPERMRVPTEEMHETLESTWKKITEGASRATLEEVRRVGTPRPSPDRVWDNVPKSKSFKEWSIKNDLPPSRASFRIRKAASPSQDELNRRVEAFIKEVNDEMRLQRQDSLNQFMEMINSGVHS